MLYLLVEVILYKLVNGETVRYRRLSLQGRLSLYDLVYTSWVCRRSKSQAWASGNSIHVVRLPRILQWLGHGLASPYSGQTCRMKPTQEVKGGLGLLLRRPLG
jgi:hypothetical protein